MLLTYVFAINMISDDICVWAVMQRRRRRDVVPSLVPADDEGSGDDTPLFNGSGKISLTPKR